MELIYRGGFKEMMSIWYFFYAMWYTDLSSKPVGLFWADHLIVCAHNNQKWNLMVSDGIAYFLFIGLKISEGSPCS